MDTSHLFEGHIYALSNTAVALNPLFTNSGYRLRFLEKVDHYLSGLCEVLQYSIRDNQYQLIVRIFDREKICNYYRLKYNAPELKEEQIPFTTHIFSQAMANLQSSAAIHFNRKEKRFGALFARRFNRELVKSKMELLRRMRLCNNSIPNFRQVKSWRYRPKFRKTMIGTNWNNSVSNGAVYIMGQHKHPILRNFLRYTEIDFQGQFKKLPPNQIYDHFSRLELVLYINKIKPKPQF